MVNRLVEIERKEMEDWFKGQWNNPDKSWTEYTLC